MECGHKVKEFGSSKGNNEYHFAVYPDSRKDFKEQLKSVEKTYRMLLKKKKISSSTSVIRKIFLSDILNQTKMLKNSCLVKGLSSLDSAGVSIVEQAPADGSKLALYAYHVEGIRPISNSKNIIEFEKNGLRHIFVLGLEPKTELSSVALQTRDIFEKLSKILKTKKASFLNDLVRTWVYLRDIDKDYEAMVKERRKIFSHKGLTSRTHFIASTGINGINSCKKTLVGMDAYIIRGTSPGQIEYLRETPLMCNPSRYGVTFERGVKVNYGDRVHIFISGTASMDQKGAVKHLDDLLGQTKCALENFGSVLSSAGAEWNDLMQMIVYLRDQSDALRVKDYLEERFGTLPIFIVSSKVCRTEWLVEIEGIAAIKTENKNFSDY